MAVTSLLLLAYLTVQVSCGQNSLTFVIDDTGSMDKEIFQVKQAAKSIVDIVLNEKSSQIQNIVLVTFNDPYTVLRKKTRDEKELKEALDSIHVYGGGDCEEVSLAGLKNGLEQSLPGSYVFVFTDASAKDFRMFEEVKTLCQKQQSQVVFILTGDCRGVSEEPYQVYHKIAAASNGQVFRIDKYEVRNVLEYVKETIKGDRTVIDSEIVPAKTWKNIPFKMDEQTQYAIVSASGDNVILQIFDPESYIIDGRHLYGLIWTYNVKVIKLTNAARGTYTVRVRGNSEVNIMIFGRTDFTFQHGFSSRVETNMRATATQPTTGIKTYLMVSVQDKTHSANIHEVELLDTSDHVIRRLTLTRVEGDIYKTEKFLSPDSTFKIVVSATSKTTGDTVKRAARTPVTPVQSVAPAILKTENVLNVKEGASTDIHCRIIKGNPWPLISWYVKKPGAEFSPLRDTTDVFHLAKVTTDDLYKCVAENVRGRDEHVVRLDVQKRPEFQKSPNTITVDDGKTATIVCKLQKGNPHPKVNWYFKSKESKDFTKLDHYGEIWDIPATRLSMAGDYKCVAQNSEGRDEKIMTLVVEVPPAISKVENVLKVKEGASTDIHCRIIKGNPWPLISWYVKKPDAEFSPLRDTTDVYFHVAKVTTDDLYKCVAENVRGRDEHVVRLDVQRRPEFQKSPNTITVDDGKTATIVCKLQKGNPHPKVNWYFKSKESKDFTKLDHYGEIRDIPATRLSMAGDYKCVAQNSEGRDEKITTLVVKVAPAISKAENVLKVKEGASTDIHCRIIKGDPWPLISWYVKKPGAEFSPLRDTTDVFHVAKVTTDDLYKCVAENVRGRDEHVVRLDVQRHPEFQKSPNTITVDDGKTATIVCKLQKGNPHPKVNWYFKSKESTDFTKLDHYGEIWDIPATRLSMAGDYKCVAQNSEGRDEKITTLVVQVPPAISKVENVLKVKEGASTDIHCRIIKGNPWPLISWYVKKPGAEFSPLRDTTDVYFHVAKVTTDDLYKCVAENVRGRDEHVVRLDVQRRPEFQKSPNTITVNDGKTATIVCKLQKGNPHPKINWYFKSKESKDFTKLDHYGEIWDIPATRLSMAGDYKCVAQNSEGRDEKITTLLVQVPPAISKVENVLKVKEGASTDIHCRIIKGNPWPLISWYVKKPDAEFSPLRDTTDVYFHVAKVTTDDLYKCVAENVRGRDEHVVRLDVQRRPEFQKSPNTITVDDGKTATIVCKLQKGNPHPKVNWYFKSKESKDFTKLDNYGEIRDIPATRLSMVGDYKCVAQNSEGRDEKITTLVVKVAPAISKAENVLKVKEGASTDIHCRIIKGDPWPLISWYVKKPGAEFSPLRDTTDVFHVAKVTTDDLYKCVAENVRGRDEHVVRLDVQRHPEFQKSPNTITVDDGKTATIVCKLQKGNPHPKVNWYFKSKESTDFTKLDHYGEIWDIPATRLSMAGDYKCVAQNSEGRDEKITTLVVQVPPAISKVENVLKVKEGASTDIHCRIIKGNPWPLISWYVKKPGAEFSPLRDTTDVYFHVAKVTTDDLYKCVAENVRGRDEHVVRLDVQRRPEFQKSPNTITVNDGKTATIVCKLQKGNPHPKINWYFKSKESKDFTKLDHYGEIWDIPATRLSMAGDYKCVAQNSEGRDEKITTLLVQVPPAISKVENVLKVKEGASTDIHCRIIKGNPWPLISWYVKKPDAEFSPLRDTTDVYFHVAKVTTDDLYKCVAENVRGRDEHVVRLDVQRRPEFQKSPNTITVDDGKTATIVCKLQKGNPHPKVNWYFKSKESKDFTKLDNYGEIRDIPATRLSMVGDYKCVAQNSEGRDEKITTLVVKVAPAISKAENVLKVKEGASTDIHCRIIKGDPWPLISWYVKKPGAEFSPLRDTTDVFHVAKVTTDDLYKCVAENVRGRDEHVVRLDVQRHPEFQKSPNTITVDDGKTATIVCKLQKGNPHPKVNWYFKSKESTDFTKLDHYGEIWDIPATRLSMAGDYKCVAQNSEGRDEKITTLVVQVPPAISKVENVLKVKEGASTDIHCRIIKGNPWPLISWYVKKPGAEFSPLRDTTDVFHVAKVTTDDLYKCVAENVRGRDEHVVRLDVQRRPEFQKSPNTITVNDGKTATIVCKLQKGNPHPKVNWYFKSKESKDFTKLDHYGEIWDIPATRLSMAGDYKCVGQNSEGRDEKITTLVVKAKPTLEKLKPRLVVMENTTQHLVCSVSSGFPKPTIDLYYKRPHSSEYGLVGKNLDSMYWRNVQLKDAGHYKCVAKNEIGQTEQVVELIVNAPPRIVFVPPNTASYSGVIGDFAMRLPCAAVGHPIPTISWEVDKQIVGNDKSKQLYVDNNALLLLHPKESDSSNKSHSYVCHAKNEFGEANQPYEVTISEYTDYDEDIKTIYAFLERPYDLVCPLHYTDPNLVRWYKNNTVNTNKTGPSLHFDYPSHGDSGNYTCRVSELTGSASHSIELIFGNPPEQGEVSVNIKWKASEVKSLACYSEERPRGEYEWSYNGQKIKSADQEFLPITGWGLYTCHITHPLGNLSLEYNVTPQDEECGIPTSFLKIKHAPLILDSTLTWPTSPIVGQNLVVHSLEKLQLICQDESKVSSNSFTKFPTSKSINAICDRGYSFLVDGVSQQISELVCKDTVTSSIHKTGKQCLGENTELMKVGFKLNGFTDVYQSCVDTIKNVPLYTKINTIAVKKESSNTNKATKTACIEDCCYEKIQLVNSADVSLGPAERATFINTLNSVNYCKPKNTTYTTWHEIENLSRERADKEKFTIWSGACQYVKIGGTWTPKYLWKVIKSWGKSETMVIIHENREKVGPKLCTGSCGEEVIWLEPTGERTYCCSLGDFKKAFSITLDFNER